MKELNDTVQQEQRDDDHDHDVDGVGYVNKSKTVSEVDVDPKDDGIGDALDEFISFQIKIVMQGTDAANPPRIKDLRAIALAT